MKKIILGDMGGYLANRDFENDEYRLDTPEPEPETLSNKAELKENTSGSLSRWAQNLLQNVISGNAKKTVGENKTRP